MVVMVVPEVVEEHVVNRLHCLLRGITQVRHRCCTEWSKVSATQASPRPAFLKVHIVYRLLLKRSFCMRHQVMWCAPLAAIDNTAAVEPVSPARRCPADVATPPKNVMIDRVFASFCDSGRSHSQECGPCELHR
jgi:hypothetical protein